MQLKQHCKDPNQSELLDTDAYWQWNKIKGYIQEGDISSLYSGDLGLKS